MWRVSPVLCASVEMAMRNSAFAECGGLFSGDVEAVGAGVQLEKAAVLFGVGDYALDVDFR
jgi:hypothetical protein